MSLSGVATITPIGYVRTPFQEKFGVPRQSGLIPSARGILKLNPDPDFRDALRHLEQFTHVWLIFQFSAHANKPWRKLTTTPRIGAPERVGVFASRSPHRPNALGLSAVKLEEIDFSPKDGIEILLSGVDLLDGTPVYDLKPYVPFVDCIREATGGFTDSDIPKFEVQFSSHAETQLTSECEAHLENNQKHGSKSAVSRSAAELKKLVTEMLELDPRPTPQKKAFPIHSESSDGMAFAFRIGELDIHWQIRKGAIEVSQVLPIKPKTA